MCTMEYYPVIKMNENLPFVTTWMDLKGNMLSEMRKTSNVWYHFYVESKKYNKLVNIKKKEIDVENKLVNTSWGGWGGKLGLGV